MHIFSINFFGLTIAPTYYGLMYVLGFVISYYILEKRKILTRENLDDLFLYIFFGVILGGRIGYILFYNFSYYSQNLIEIFKIWEGGMSFHGGAIGVIIAMILFSKKYKFSFLKLSDNIVSVLPIGLFFGRIGNYLNKELLGFQYTGFLRVEKNGNYYFPSPLLEAFLEGIILFLILFFINKYKKIDGIVASSFLIFYSIFRIFVEIFFRSPDIQIGYIYGFLTMGEILSSIMLFTGIIIFIYLKRKNAIRI
ncbi:MAG: prolipoprotein diacylglyceryl transferase [Candidatus Gracilibacteria bacterium]|nr:prolipoprotein diacylglyceryl transferase [Candidatus Gracilibacteria bacterium]